MLHTHDMECVRSLTCNNTRVQKPCKICVHKAVFPATRAWVCMVSEQPAKHELLVVLTDLSSKCRLTYDSR